ncbi:MAG: tetratricopeptide repeat protein, partial [Planctomycetales bacterium]|nr:tetratricopeptide repeat protein [Planctomycetales bacterium]
LLARLRPGGWLYRNVRDRFESGFLAKGDYAGLADFYANAVSRSPDDLALKLRLGQIQAIAGRYDASEKTLEGILARAPNDTEVRKAIIDVLIRADRPSRTEPHFDKLAQLDPNNPDHFLYWARVRLSDTDVPQRQRYEAAAEIWERLLQSRDDDPNIHARVAKLYANLRETDRAIALYQKAIELAPDSHQYREYLGEYFHTLKRTDEAIETWRSIATGSRRNQDSLVRLAEVFATFKYQDESLQAWREASTFDLSFDQRLRYAHALGLAKQHDQAIAQLESAMQIAQSRDERDRVSAAQVSQYVDSKKVMEKISEINALKPTLDNRRFLAMLLLAVDDVPMAAVAIDAAASISPDDPGVLMVAADIAERQKRLFDAILTYERLVEIDSRFRTWYLQRIIALHRSLGNPIQAIGFARDLINVNPNAPDPYRILADIALEIGRDEQAVVALRQAIDLAPRDNTSRLVLARHYAKRSKTAEALELYWESLKHQRDWPGRKKLVGEMASLHDHGSDSEPFIRRIEQFFADDSDRYQTRRLVATFWQEMGDHKRASFILEQLIAEHPGDEGLLKQIVESYQSLANHTATIKYQSQLADLTGDQKDIELLTRIRLAAGDVQHLELFARELAATSDPATIASIINRAIIHDRTSAEDLCRVACLQDETLWGIKCVRLQLLMTNRGNGQADKLSETLKLADEIEQLDLDADAAPPSNSYATTKSSPKSQLASLGHQVYQLRTGATTDRHGVTTMTTIDVPKSQFAMHLGHVLGTVDRFGRRIRSSWQNQPEILIPTDYNQALWISRATRILIHCRLNEIAGQPQPLPRVIEQLYPMPDAQQTTNPRRLEQLLSLHYLEGSLSGLPQPVPEELLWRMVDADPQGDHPKWIEILAARNRDADETPESPQGTPVPLNEQQLRIISKVVSQRQRLPSAAKMTAEQIDGELLLRRCMYREYQLAGKSLTEHPPIGELPRPTSFMQALANIQIALWENDSKLADQLVSELPQIARDGSRQEVVDILTPQSNVTWYWFPSTPLENQFVRRHRDTLIDAWLAHCARRRGFADRSVTTEDIINQFGQGAIFLVANRPKSQSVNRPVFRLETTISNRFFDEYLLTGLAQLIYHYHPENAELPTLTVPDGCLSAMDRRLETRTQDEIKLLRIVVAFASHWQNRREDCYRQIRDLCDQFPGDIGLQIEAARMEFDLDRSDAAFDRLGAIQRHSDRDEIQVGLAKAHLSLRMGFIAPARLAGSNLLQLQLDTKTRASLHHRLSEYGLKPNSNWAVISETRLRYDSESPFAGVNVRQDDGSQLRLASELLATGNPMTASEIAHSVIQNGVRSGDATWRVLRRRAVDLLIRADRLEPLIATMEQNVQADPESEWHRHELTQLYLQNGQGEKATRIWEQAIIHDGLTADELIAMADTLHREHHYHEAAIVYLFAFERSPQLWKTEWSAFVQTAELSENPDSIFARLCRHDLRSYSLFSLCNVVRISTVDQFSDSQRAFVRHLVQTHPDVAKKTSLLKRFIPDAELKHFPELAE